MEKKVDKQNGNWVHRGIWDLGARYACYEAPMLFVPRFIFLEKYGMSSRDNLDFCLPGAWGISPKP